VNWWRAWVLSRTTFFLTAVTGFMASGRAGRLPAGDMKLSISKFLRIYICIYVCIYIDIGMMLICFFNIYSFYYPCYTVTKPIHPNFSDQKAVEKFTYPASGWARGLRANRRMEDACHESTQKRKFQQWNWEDNIWKYWDIVLKHGKHVYVYIHIIMHIYIW